MVLFPSKEFLEIQATIECRFILKLGRDNNIQSWNAGFLQKCKSCSALDFKGVGNKMGIDDGIFCENY